MDFSDQTDIERAGYELGKAKGFEEGLNLGLKEGIELGLGSSFSYYTLIGTYRGWANSLLRHFENSTDQKSSLKAIKALNSLLSQIEKFPLSNEYGANIDEHLKAVSAKYKLATTSVGLHTSNSRINSLTF
ncbi:Oral cancer-overexpressed protein 1 [Smittium culicis]|uniref:Oral cancer-overexpressed protein 1 n=1 Tax=Smittium culicis TaxID=133412 RepID=A0A1R1Y1Q1_9FUNG|nr:Oral cancer-overexpressed protein 1 [Smittium culicis]OMJ20755.1 Oral cancer-overexpressed protein 1 [Smittium culicis]